ncbi:MAG: C2 family cysteine protease [Pseudomonadota bacterium]
MLTSATHDQTTVRDALALIARNSVQQALLNQAVERLTRQAVLGLGSEFQFPPLGPQAKNVDELMAYLFASDGKGLSKDSLPPGLASAQLLGFIEDKPSLKPAIIKKLAQYYWKTAGADPKKRALMTEMLREAGLSKEVSVELNALAKQHPTDPDLNPQLDEHGNPITLSAAQQVLGRDLPSVYQRKSDFLDAMILLDQHLDGHTTDTLATLRELPLDDPRWSSEFGIPPGARAAAQKAAAIVLDPRNAEFLANVQARSGGGESAPLDLGLGVIADIFAGLRPGTADGRIDEFTQGGVGDCFALAAINAVNQTPAGREQIMNSITHHDGVYSVQFAGDPNHTVFTVTEEEVAEATKISDGDHDVAILELAMEKYSQIRGGTIFDGGQPSTILSLLTGHPTRSSVEGTPRSADALIEEAASSPQGFSMTLSCGVSPEGLPLRGRDPASVSWHAFTVTDVDLKAGTITLENPWDTTKSYTVRIDQVGSMGTISVSA